VIGAGIAGLALVVSLLARESVPDQSLGPLGDLDLGLGALALSGSLYDVSTLFSGTLAWPDLGVSPSPLRSFGSRI
jgi:hypothetical protein